jgi:surfeit locus 1 family protein
MIRRLPVAPTVIVLLAVALMVRLGFWQIDRMHQKEAMLARFSAAQAMSAEWDFRSANPGDPASLYRHTRIECVAANGISARSGQDARGRAGWAHIARCELFAGDEVEVVLGWSDRPTSPVWNGGVVTGVIAPGPRIVADPPLAGLEPSARPDPVNIPNNHWSYAIQWFLFALTALVIYGLAVRKRLAGTATGG